MCSNVRLLIIPTMNFASNCGMCTWRECVLCCSCVCSSLLWSASGQNEHLVCSLQKWRFSLQKICWSVAWSAELCSLKRTKAHRRVGTIRHHCVLPIVKFFYQKNTEMSMWVKIILVPQISKSERKMHHMVGTIRNHCALSTFTLFHQKINEMSTSADAVGSSFF